MAKTVAASESVSSFLKRSMKGTSFLALEHAMHVVFIVVVSALITVGLVLGTQLWTGQTADPLMGLAFNKAPELVTATGTLAVVAALVVLSPFLVILDKRTRAERAKRKEFEKRLAYKAPMYVGLAVIWAIKLSAIVTLVAVLLYTLAGMNHLTSAELMQMYQTQFVPALITLLVFGTAGWYLIRWAQGKNYSRKFNLAWLALASVLAIALFVTATIMLQNPDAFNNGSQLMPDYGSDLPIFKY